ncbi:hypothetical protein GCM10027614_09580 [Micromonospora vulcania]
MLAYRPGALDGPVAALRGLPAELPVDVTGAVQLDVDGLTDEQRRMLEATSVCAEGFEPTLAAALAGHPPECASDLLDALVAADLLRTDATEASTLRFRHEVDRTVVYRSLSPVGGVCTPPRPPSCAISDTRSSGTPNTCRPAVSAPSRRPQTR